MFLILFSIVQNKIKNLKISVSFFQCQKRSKIFRTPNGHSFFYIEAQNFENCTHAVIRFLQRNTELWKLYPMAIIISLKEMRNLTIYHQCMYPSGHSFVYREIRNFTVVPKQPFVFYSEIQNSTVVLKRPFVFHSEIRNLELYPSN